MALHPFHKGHKKLGGRKAGTPNKRTLDLKEFFRGLLTDPIILQKWKDELHSSKPLGRSNFKLIELAYAYAWGKPKEKIDLGVSAEDLHFTLTIADGYGNKLTMAPHEPNGNGLPPVVIDLPPAP